MSEISFPALGFAPDRGRGAIPGRERVIAFLSAEDFSTAASWELEHWPRLRMQIADASGRSWEVVRVTDLGIIKPLWERLIRWLLQQSVHRIQQDLIALEPLALDAIKERVCDCIQANPDDWRDDEAIAGEDGPPREEQELLDELKKAVRQARSVPQIINALYDEHLDG
jgi:hypothetical protein